MSQPQHKANEPGAPKLPEPPPAAGRAFRRKIECEESGAKAPRKAASGRARGARRAPDDPDDGRAAT